MKRYQYGFDLFFRILWISVSPERFGKKISPLFLRPGQEDFIKPAELLPIFTDDFVMRDGWRLYRAVSMN